MTSILPTDLIAPFILTHHNKNDDALDWTWKETPDSHIFKFDLPGYSKSDINVQIHTDTRILHITTNTTDHKQGLEEDDDDVDGKTVTWHCRERVGSSRGKFSKKFRLPKDAKIDGIEATMKDGVLVVSVAKESGGGGGEEKVKKRSVVIEGEDEDRSGGKVGGGGGMLGKCFVCFKS